VRRTRTKRGSVAPPPERPSVVAAGTVPSVSGSAILQRRCARVCSPGYCPTSRQPTAAGARPATNIADARATKVSKHTPCIASPPLPERCPLGQRAAQRSQGCVAVNKFVANFFRLFRRASRTAHDVRRGECGGGAPSVPSVAQAGARCTSRTRRVHGSLTVRVPAAARVGARLHVPAAERDPLSLHQDRPGAPRGVAGQSADDLLQVRASPAPRPPAPNPNAARGAVCALARAGPAGGPSHGDGGQGVCAARQRVRTAHAFPPACVQEWLVPVSPRAVRAVR